MDKIFMIINLIHGNENNSYVLYPIQVYKENYTLLKKKLFTL